MAQMTSSAAQGHRRGWNLGCQAQAAALLKGSCLAGGLILLSPTPFLQGLDCICPSWSLCAIPAT